MNNYGAAITVRGNLMICDYFKMMEDTMTGAGREFAEYIKNNYCLQPDQAEALMYLVDHDEIEESPGNVKELSDLFDRLGIPYDAFNF